MIQGFISYAHDDGEAFDTMRTHLHALEQAFTEPITLWADDKLRAGLHWDDTIKARIEAAALFILLLSPAFLASEYIVRDEIPAIRTRVAAAKGLICPVLLSDCGWEPLVGQLQTVPSDNRRLRAIDDWDPPRRGFNAARVQIDEAVRLHFDLKPRQTVWYEPMAKQPQDPAGLMVVQRNDQFDLDPSGGTGDTAALRDPAVRQLHPRNREKAAALAALIARRANALDTEWADLAPAAAALATGLACPLEDVPDHVVSLWERSVDLASLLLLDKRLLAAPEDGLKPLPADIHRALDGLVGSLAPWIRAFPAARRLDDLRGAFLLNQALFQPARTLIQQAEARGVVTPAVGAALQAGIHVAERGDAQADKVGEYAIRGVRNLLVSTGVIAAAYLAGETPPSGLLGRAGGWLREGAPEVSQFAAGFPDDLRVAYQRLPGELAAPLVPRTPVPGVARPSWADDAGTDRYGRWATFGVDAKDGTRVMQRMRWIPPGRFVMGSPKGEEGRFDDREGPQHEVVIGAGFWLADTPCTQALWRAVVGDNPSYFKSPDRPVESASFDQVEGFIQRLNGLVAGLALELPSEARWEYACRAGTTTATYAGDLEILGDNNAPVLDAIAWYGGNSGLDFDLSNGADSSKWAGKQYPHTRAGTRPVARKLPNDWGLYDMLGNVWEWCADDWHDNYEGAPADGAAWRSPAGSRAGDAGRVFRGGAWDFGARSVRSACRYGYGPEYQDFDLGFRFALVQ